MLINLFIKYPIVPVISLLLFVGCINDKGGLATIQGNIPNLPDGTLYLVKYNQDKADSAKTRNGKFKLYVNKPKSFEPFLVSIVHVDRKNNKRFISFPSKKKMHGGPLYLSSFYYGEDIDIEGEIKNFNPRYGKFPGSIKLVTLKGHVLWGKQNKVMYDVDFKIPASMTDSAFNSILKVIKKYPYSYYLLSTIRSNLTRFTNSQLQIISDEFSPGLKNRSDMRYIIFAIKNRDSHSIDPNITMPGPGGSPVHIIDTTATVNMIIFWASWCGPCLKEIPVLRKIHQEFEGKGLSMTSVSLDKYSKKWKKKLASLAMNWPQAVVSDLPKTTGIFNLDGSIPHTIFTNGRGKILAAYTGYDPNIYKKYSTLINQYLIKSMVR